MRGQIDTFWLPKAGATEAEYEDASANSVSDELTVELPAEHDDVRVAVADGATESLLSGRWARALSRRVATDDIPHRRWHDAIKSAIDDWPADLCAYREERLRRKKPIAWYEEPGLERGAEATLVALRLRNPVDGRPGFWWSMAVGDATLFHIRGDGFTRAFPMKRSAAFSTSPHLIRSLDHESGFKRRLRKTSGEWEPEDLFFLCTDALAAWFLERQEESDKPWRVWQDFGSLDCLSFEEWVTDERSSGRLKNDDVTLVRVHCF
ncbi:protein phosphatase 2C domain-containing protein [Mycolicibacterium rufum]|uniref:Protein phosphatase 2C domain-containing protein n=1 Tax=Mycolicibacterium rufum TaxID=318424 RepID=A0A9X2YBR2_9MYCO|nr:protein phosphatase 2C domain-containing protein [Mycolicibacterium rufum]KGI66855.1 hypothetical protein EU78_04530 [Mycolicibacterium rufum]MCV7071054.1 protein phosphatase 2C domain-containing protein [Mycolicibacterium rufum]ULP37676.1 protein phosphatase 2C domain-containing protein [Mycolicibacterium rufum]